MNVVSEGVREAMKKVLGPTPFQVKQANAALGLQLFQSNYLSQLTKKREAMNQMQQMFLASKQQDQQQTMIPQQAFDNFQNPYPYL